VALVVLEVGDVGVGDIGDAGADADGDTEPIESFVGLDGQFRWVRRQDPIESFQQ
jgi:hypothetical protein